MNASMSHNSGRHIFGTGIIAVLVLDVMELTLAEIQNLETGKLGPRQSKAFVKVPSPLSSCFLGSSNDACVALSSFATLTTKRLRLTSFCFHTDKTADEKWNRRLFHTTRSVPFEILRLLHFVCSF